MLFQAAILYYSIVVVIHAFIPPMHPTIDCSKSPPKEQRKSDWHPQTQTPPNFPLKGNTQTATKKWAASYKSNWHRSDSPDSARTTGRKSCRRKSPIPSTNTPTGPRRIHRGGTHSRYYRRHSEVARNTIESLHSSPLRNPLHWWKHRKS